VVLRSRYLHNRGVRGPFGQQQRGACAVHCNDGRRGDCVRNKVWAFRRRHYSFLSPRSSGGREGEGARRCSQTQELLGHQWAGRVTDDLISKQINSTRAHSNLQFLLCVSEKSACKTLLKFVITGMFDVKSAKVVSSENCWYLDGVAGIQSIQNIVTEKKHNPRAPNPGDIKLTNSCTIQTKTAADSTMVVCSGKNQPACA